ncbi:MAG: antibiotic biosynthesis monooxygenase [Desulfovibrio sp.]|jgi:quinol monooxygenase YgiN|nr:antibiotic biosynthesis monooxygenase [Desulfovibrio sp.]
MQQDIHVTAHIRIMPGHRDEFLRKMKTLIPLGKAMEGNRNYALLQNLADPDSFVVTAQWASAEDIHKHEKTPEFAGLIRLFSSGACKLLPLRAKKIF